MKDFSLAALLEKTWVAPRSSVGPSFFTNSNLEDVQVVKPFTSLLTSEGIGFLTLPLDALTGYLTDWEAETDKDFNQPIRV